MPQRIVLALALAWSVAASALIIDPHSIDLVLPESTDYWWPVDEGAGTTVRDRMAGQDGTITGATWISDTTNGNALDFDYSEDYVATPLNIDMDDTDWSLSFCASVDDRARNTLFSAAASTSNYWLLVYRAARGGVVLQYSVSGAINYIEATLDPTFGTWMSYALVIGDGASNNVKIYQDGTEIADNNLAVSGFTAAPLYMGGANPNLVPTWTATYWMQGALKKVAYYDHALSPAEVGALVSECPEL